MKLAGVREEAAEEERVRHVLYPPVILLVSCNFTLTLARQSVHWCTRTSLRQSHADDTLGLYRVKLTGDLQPCQTICILFSPTVSETFVLSTRLECRFFFFFNKHCLHSENAYL